MNQHVFQRHEAKYLVTQQQREQLEQVCSLYMKPDAYGQSTICNIYYDTPDYRLIRHSLEKPIYKEKLRLRSYGTVSHEDEVFLELKKKYKGVVYKRRIALTEQSAMNFLQFHQALPETSQIAREITYFCSFYHDLQPKVYLSYDRNAYFSETDDSFRITFDKNICWRQEDFSLTKPAGGYPILDDCQSLCEIKTAGAIPMWLVALLDKLEIRQISFSKYGRAYQNILSDILMESRGFCYV